MARRQAFMKDAGGTLSFAVPEPGSIEASDPAPTVELFDAAGASMGAPVTAAIASSPSRLSVVLSSEATARIGANYRALWTYAIAARLYRRNQTFDVVAAELYPPITTTAQLARHFPLLEGRDFPGTAKIVDLGAVAWDELLERIVARGRNPNFIVDPAPLETPLASLWASHVARNYRPGGATSNAWQEFAAARDVECNERLDAALANLAWYDADQDRKPADDEQQVDTRTLFLSR